jgi:protein ImuB
VSSPSWRHTRCSSSPAALADRVRWQLDGWLTGTGRRTGGVPARPTAGIDRLRLVPDGVVRHAGMQAGLWGELGAADERAHRALVRVQGLLGPDSVFTTVLGGGRSYADRVRLVPWGDERTPRRPGGAGGGEWAGGGVRRGDPVPPWPGRLPAPAPAVVLTQPVPISVRTAVGAPVLVTDRLAMSGVPVDVVIGKERPVAVTGWAGPWPAQERWWAPAEASIVVRLQLSLADGRALLVTGSGVAGSWRLEASYD